MSINKSHPHHAVIKSAGIIGFATFCSRILGFIRDVTIARLFGVYVYAQAFVVAFKIPNLFRDLLGEGAANAAIVPVFSEYTVKHNKEEFWELVNVVFNLLLVILMGLTVLGVLFAPLLVRLIAPGFIADPQKLQTTVLLARIIFPYVLLISLAAYVTAILNSLKTFAISAFAPCLLNISIIIFAMMFGEGIRGLASGVLAGGILQLAVQIPALYRKGFRLSRFLKNFRHPAAKIIGKLMLPRLFSSCIYQLNNFVDSIFGSLSLVVGEGGVAGLYFAYRLIQFPLGIFSNSLSQAILPAFSTQALEETQDKIKHTLSFGLRVTSFVMLPASVGFMVLSRPLIAALFGGGKFDSYSVVMTADTLFYYSIGLFAYAAAKIVQSCFFALKDTVTPTKMSFLALIMNIVLNAFLIFPMKLAGIALATSISAICSFLALFFVLKKRLFPFYTSALVFSFLRILLASICMGLVCYFFPKELIPGEGALNRFANLALLLSVSIVSYSAFCIIFKVGEMREAWKFFLQKSRKQN